MGDSLAKAKLRLRHLLVTPGPKHPRTALSMASPPHREANIVLQGNDTFYLVINRGFHGDLARAGLESSRRSATLRLFAAIATVFPQPISSPCGGP